MSGTGSRRRGFAVWRGMLLAGSFALVALTAPGAFAADPTPAELREARDLFGKAEKDEKAGDWSAALEKLRRVAQIKVTPGVRFHLALAEEKTGLLVTALADYAMAEKQATDEKNRDVLAALREPIAALQARVPRLVVKAPPDVKGLEVSVDGKILAPGLYAAEMPVDPKSHTVEAKAPGKKPFTQTVASQERDTKTVDVVLEDESKVVPAPVPPVPTAGGAQTPPTTPPVTPSPPPGTTPKGESKTGAVLATVGAVALIGVGVGAYVIADGKQSDGRAQCLTLPTQSACDDLRSPVRTWDTVALAAWVGGAALATVAIVLWATPGAGGSARASGRVYVGPGAAGLAGSF
jgi:hypothetical protein